IVDKLINGFFDYDCGKLNFSVPKIEATIPPGELYEGTFTLKSATETPHAAADEGALRGL
ncbi:MAG: DUF5717 family protein, partial [Lachnospiraceae bacterium]|nr:DUF5717 family protein [Lachnospiraceae bacterium]